jgi:hypothetical protein
VSAPPGSQRSRSTQLGPISLRFSLRRRQVDFGRLLGIGAKVVTITGDKIEQLPRVKQLLSDADVLSLPEAKTQ